MPCMSSVRSTQSAIDGAALDASVMARNVCKSRGLGWQIHESVEDTKLSTNKQHTLSQGSGL
jgi:hypothetical protein